MTLNAVAPTAGPAAGTLSRQAREIGRIAREAMISEVEITPKPGLVDRRSSGAHQDMDYALFRVSIDAISPWLERFAQAGIDFAGSEAASLFPTLKAVGIQAEAAMFSSTGGVNTHKGLIFSLGLLCGAAGYLGGRRDRPDADLRPFAAEAVCAAAAGIAAGLADRHFAGAREPGRETYGERIQRLYGITGARGEAEAGFPHVLRYGLPLLCSLEPRYTGSSARTCDKVGVTLLLALMSEVPDTNILGRHGPTELERVRAEARDAFAAGAMFTPAGRRMVDAMRRRFVAGNISPGGSADLVAVTLFLRRLSG